MLETSRLYLQHPKGHTEQLPCHHLVPEHPDGHQEWTPCLHAPVRQHSSDRVGLATVPCIHWVAPHPAGHAVNVPCLHMRAEHPEGHPGPTVPCPHPMTPVRVEFGGRLLFYTNNTVIQQATIQAVSTFNQLGVNLLGPRPLHVFHRTPLAKGDNSDPFWSHYNPVSNTIQVIDRGQPDAEKLDTLRHELGHAIVGNKITNHYADGGHNMKEPADSYALAMSEGWAHFVGLALSHDRSAKELNYKKEKEWEKMNLSPPNGKIEYCVACCLWDLFDTAGSRPGGMLGGWPVSIVVPDDDKARLAFTELFRVYSPTLETLTHGPWISSIWDFLDRIKANNPGQAELAAVIDQVRDRNVGPRPPGV